MTEKHDTMHAVKIAPLVTSMLIDVMLCLAEQTKIGVKWKIGPPEIKERLYFRVKVPG